MSRSTVCIVFVCGMSLCQCLCADVSLEDKALAVLAENCVSCHGKDVAESALRLDSAELVLRGGDSGEQTVIPGDVRRSYLLERITTGDSSKRMPPDEDRLADEDIQVLQQWIGDKEFWNRTAQAIKQERSSHWAFQPLVKPEVPASERPSPVDAFIEAGLRDAGLHMSSRASGERLVRRLYLVMHGLPPTPEQVDAFLADESPDAWQSLVDDVLQSPRYGERLATFWLDLIRFAETNGYETNRERPNAWHFRDWVIESFQTDKPYDEFIKAQLAGDALKDPVATGFLVAGPHDIVKGKDKQLGLIQRQDELDGIISGDWSHISWTVHGMCPMPQPQVRPHPADRLLLTAGGVRRRQLCQSGSAAGRSGFPTAGGPGR